MSEPKSILISKEKYITTITLNRPHKHNAFDHNLIAQLISSLETIHHDNTTRVVILNAKGDNFCAGADLNWMKNTIKDSMETNFIDAMELAKLMDLLNHLNKPTIAAVQGLVFGGGIGLVACCDIALASENAVFCFSEVKLGLIPAVISPYVIAAMGQRLCRRLFLTAEKFNAEKALEYGLLHQVCNPNDLNQQALNLANLITKNAPTAVSHAKLLIGDVSNRRCDSDLIRDTAMRIAKLRVSEEGQAGLNAFFNKQIPYWNQENGKKDH